MKIIFISGFLVLTCLFISGCEIDKLEHIEAQEFLGYTNGLGMAFPMSGTEFIGSTRNRVYIEHTWYLDSITQSTIYWTELDKLPEEVAEKIKSGQPPWIPFDHKMYEHLKRQNRENETIEELFGEPVPIDLSKP